MVQNYDNNSCQTPFLAFKLHLFPVNSPSTYLQLHFAVHCSHGQFCSDKILHLKCDVFLTSSFLGTHPLIIKNSVRCFNHCLQDISIMSMRTKKVNTQTWRNIQCWTFQKIQEKVWFTTGVINKYQLSYLWSHYHYCVFFTVAHLSAKNHFSARCTKGTFVWRKGSSKTRAHLTTHSRQNYFAVAYFVPHIIWYGDIYVERDRETSQQFRIYRRKNTSAWGQNFLYSGSRNRLISCVQFFQFHDFWATKVSNYQTATLSSPSWVYTAEQLFWCIWNVEWNKWPTKLYSNILLWRGNWVAVILDGKVWPSPHNTRPNSSASPSQARTKIDCLNHSESIELFRNHRFRDSSSYQPRLTASSAILKPIFAKKLLQLGDFALQQQWFFHVIPMETLTGYNLT